MTDSIFEEIRVERKRQDEKFGEQNMPMIGCFEGKVLDQLLKEHEELAKDFKAINDTPGASTWLSVLLEEVYEAFAETEPEKQREEMIQVAAVAVAIIEYLDRGMKNEN